jgi:hypothetical protein
MNKKHFEGTTFEEVFININKEITENPEYTFKSRIGETYEVTNITFEVTDPSSYHILNPNINRIKYDYAITYYDFMMSGGGTKKAMVAFAGNERALQFVRPPKSDVLPENFNTLYGPRIIEQLPAVINELADNPNSRRASLMILDPKDHALLELDEKIEYPCCFNATYYIRDNKLNAHINMRSQNTAIVLQMDIYIHARLMMHVMKELNTCRYELQLGTMSYHMVSGHVYERDLEYVESFAGPPFPRIR